MKTPQTSATDAMGSMTMWLRRFGHSCVPIEPRTHAGNFLLLCGHNMLREPAHLRIPAISKSHLSHCRRTLMVRDHAAHEVDVGIAGVTLAHGLHHAVMGATVGGG